MKPLILQLCLLFAASIVSFAQGISSTPVPSEIMAEKALLDWDASRVIHRRVQSNDKQALRELSSLDPIVAIPMLSYYANDRRTDPESAIIALETLRRMHGLRDYYRNLVNALHAQAGKSMKVAAAFRTLALIGTKDAVAAVGPFLFDESASDASDEENDHGGWGQLKYMAVSSLMDMKLPNAPTDKPSYTADEDDIIKWRKWWLMHKLEYE